MKRSHIVAILYVFLFGLYFSVQAQDIENRLGENGKFYIINSNGEILFAFDSFGQLGLGTTSPSEILDILIPGESEIGGIWVSRGHNLEYLYAGCDVTGGFIELVGDDDEFVKIKKGDIKATGSISASNITIDAATRKLSIHPAAFVPRNHDTGYWLSDISLYGRLMEGQNPGHDMLFYAPVHLPDGATVTKFSAVVRDEDTDHDISVYLRSAPFNGGYVTIANITSSGTPGITSLITTSMTSALIDNGNNTYYVLAQWKMPAMYYHIGLQAGVIIEYSVTTPLP